MSRPLEVRLLLATAFALYLVALFASVWEVAALQPPDSPLHVGILAGPIAQLAVFAFAHATVNALVALAWPLLYERTRGRHAAWLLVAGALLHVAALTFAAARGLLAVQLLDPRADARTLLYTRALALSLIAVALVMLLVRALRSPNVEQPSLVGEPQQRRDDQAG